LNSLDYLDSIRGERCLVCGNPAILHHLSAIGMGRKRKNPLIEHFTAIPLCHEHHNLGGDSIHRLGVLSFQKKFKINVWEWVAKSVINWVTNAS